MSDRNTAPPKKAFLELTRVCNSSCSHCLNSSGSRMESELHSDEILDLVRRLAAFGLQEIRFTGGEPTVHPILREAIALAASLGIKTSIGTNAMTITDTFAHELSGAGLQKAVVSIDGDETSHDHVRGFGSYRRTWSGVQALRAAKIEVRINAVAMKTTYAGLRHLGELCRQKHVSLFIRRYIPSGRASGNLSEILTSADYARLRVELRDLLDDGTADGHHLSSKHNHCSAGTSGLVILPDGKVQSCGFLSGFGEEPYGNIRFDDLAAIWERVVHSPFLRENQSRLKVWARDHVDLPETNCPAMSIGIDGLVQIRRNLP
ncbi:MAG: radical SAM protein [bacterium]|nr:radical SAM protein [bacterium]